MTTTTPKLIVRELPATKTTDPDERARAAPYRYSAEWETPEGLDDETDPMWGAIGFGPTEAAAQADLAAQTARNLHRQPDQEIREALGSLADDAEVMISAVACAERYARRAFDTAADPATSDATLLVQNGQAWTDAAAALNRLLDADVAAMLRSLPGAGVDGAEVNAFTWSAL